MAAAEYRVLLEIAGHVFRTELPGVACGTCGWCHVGKAPLRRFHLTVADELLTAGERSGEVLRFAREALGLDTVELAARLGLAETELERWERRPLVYRTALEVAAALVRAELDVPVESATFVLGSTHALPRDVDVNWLRHE